MRLVSTIELYAGGPGSGCQGPNCGRPKSTAEIREGVSGLRGLKNYRHVGREYGLVKGYPELKWAPDKFPRQALFENMGVSRETYDEMHRLVGSWSDVPDKEVRKQLSSVVKNLANGKLNDPLTRAFAIEHALTQKVLGNRDFVTLYRGVPDTSDEKQAAKGRANFESWTKSRTMAARFANGSFFEGRGDSPGVVVKARVPREAIITSSDTNPKLFESAGFHGNQHEYLVGRPLGKIKVLRTRLVRGIESEAQKFYVVLQHDGSAPDFLQYPDEHEDTIVSEHNTREDAEKASLAMPYTKVMTNPRMRTKAVRQNPGM